MAESQRPWTWAACLGRDGWDQPLNVPDDMGQEALNIEFIDGALGKKRTSTTIEPLQGYGPNPANLRQLFSFIPAGDPTQAQMWVLDSGSPPTLWGLTPTGGTTFGLADPITGDYNVVSAAAMHGKFYFAYHSSGVNRLHVYDYRNGGIYAPITRVGLAAPPAPVATNTGTGSYPATLRYYRVASFSLNATTGEYFRASNLGTALSATPSGTGLAARVTAPTFPDGPTHWQVYGSADGAAYYELSPILPVATTYWDDTTLPANYNANDPAPLEGANTPFPSCKYIASDGIHLFGLGVWETAAGDSVPPVSGRVYFTPALGSSDFGDDERVSNSIEAQGWINVNPGGGGIDRAIAGPLFDRMYAFQSQMIVMLVPTGQADQPFARVVITSQYGAVSNRSTFIGEDEYGQPALYFLDPRDGPRRLSPGRAITWLGRDVSDVWQTINLDSSDAMHGVYDARRKLAIWWICTGNNGAGQVPDTMIVYNVALGRVTEQGIRYGWAKWTGAFAAANASLMFSRVMARNNNRSEWLVPYGALGNFLVRQEPTPLGAPLALDCWDLTLTHYQTFQAYVRSKAWARGSFLSVSRETRAVLVALNTGASLQLTIDKDYGAVLRNETITLSPQTDKVVNTPTRVRVAFDTMDVADAAIVTLVLGDASGSLVTPWSLDSFMSADEGEGAR